MCLNRFLNLVKFKCTFNCFKPSLTKCLNVLNVVNIKMRPKCKNVGRSPPFQFVKHFKF